MKRCRLVLVSCMLFFAIMLVDSNVLAYGYDFEITANYSWGTDFKSGKITKDGYNHFSGVTWQYSSKSSHKMVFRVCNASNGKSFGSGTLSYLSQGTFRTDMSDQQESYLQARRENIIDPLTTVRGFWLP